MALSAMVAAIVIAVSSWARESASAWITTIGHEKAMLEQG